MSYATLIIDGRTELDDDIIPGQKAGPAQLAQMVADAVKPGAADKQPYMLAAMGTLLQAVKEGQPIHITVETRPLGWTLTVNHVGIFATGKA